jgi:hypothetical protein
MNIFDKLEEIYLEVDNNYASLEVKARFKGHHKKEAKYSSNRQSNDEAYYLFMFTRLEDRVKVLSELLIDKKVASLTDWKNKRTWDILHKRKKNIPFMDRVALLTKINTADYMLINRYYLQRNSIAHGGTFTTPINITTVVRDMKRLYKDLA